ncbi:MAG: DUF2796 domain-containing protein [Helicobacteraceae bacterium]|jgi:hypothetical protein|nr:DUF2796 domain-containing protein [Helicobacteraceae bacterium]
MYGLTFGRLAAAIALMAAAAQGAHEHAAHEHGVARLNVSIGAKAVSIELESPLANLLSFEHTPESEAEKKEANAMEDTLKKADAIFIFPKSANCKMVKVELSMAHLDDDEDEEDDDEHAEHAEHAEHIDLDGDFDFECQNTAAIGTIGVELFKFFPNIEEIEARVVTQKSQSAVELTPKEKTIKIGR